MPKVFISHSSQDRELVEREIVALLQSHGIETWYSKDSIQTAAQWQRSIEVGLESCDWFLLVMTPRSLDSDWVLAEVTWWMEERKGNFIPVLADDCEWKRFHLFIRQFQYVDFRSGSEETWQKFLQLWGIEAKQQQPALANAPFDTDQARKYQEDWAQYLQADVVVTNSIGMKLVLIPAGEFQMGAGKSAEDEAKTFDAEAEDFSDEHPQHKVRITKQYYLGIHEVTQGQWGAVMGSKPWSGQINVKEGPDYPASYVSWEDAQEFCQRLSEREGMTYRLPTEAEWEYACQAGTRTRFSFGDEPSLLGEYAWYHDNTYDKDEKYAHRVGQKKPNPWGLYNIHGNVWEWCSDWYTEDYYGQSPMDDPPGPPPSDLNRVVRGGGWLSPADGCRSASRSMSMPSHRNYLQGFRVATVPPSK